MSPIETSTKRMRLSSSQGDKSFGFASRAVTAARPTAGPVCLWGDTGPAFSDRRPKGIHSLLQAIPGERGRSRNVLPNLPDVASRGQVSLAPGLMVA